MAAGGVRLVDEAIREYLVFRGFTGALRAFEADLRADKVGPWRGAEAGPGPPPGPS